MLALFFCGTGFFLFRIKSVKIGRKSRHHVEKQSLRLDASFRRPRRTHKTQHVRFEHRCAMGFAVVRPAAAHEQTHTHRERMRIRILVQRDCVCSASDSINASLFPARYTKHTNTHTKLARIERTRSADLGRAACACNSSFKWLIFI